MKILSWLVAGLAAYVSADSLDLVSRSNSTGACNNSPSLCSKPYNQVVHLGAHDSAFVRDASTSYSTSANQYYNVTVGLSAGVRLLTAQVHYSNRDWHLCHSSCDLLDAGPLSAWLAEIKKWMDQNPTDVVTVLLVNSDGASRTQIHQQYQKSNILPYVYTPPSSAAPASWPTLGNLISANTRLISFVAAFNATDAPSGTGYLMTEWDYIFENAYDNSQYTDFSCIPNRPTNYDIPGALGANLMPLMNHFLYKVTKGIITIETPAVDNITTTNSPSETILGALGQSGDACTTAYGGRPPTFILVDFFSEGPAIQTVDRLNGVTNPVGRTAPPPRDSGSGNTRDAASWAGVVALAEQVRNGETPTTAAWIWAAGKWSWGGLNLGGGDWYG